MLTKLFENFSTPQLMYILCSFGILAIAGQFICYWFVPQQLGFNISAGIISSVIMGLLSHAMAHHVTRRSKKIVGAMHALAEGNLSHKCPILGKDDYAWMSYEYNNARKVFSTMINEMNGHSDQVVVAAEELSNITDRSKHAVATQDTELTQVASAMNQMSATVGEVAQNAANAAETVQNADEHAINGNKVVKATIDTINTLANEVEKTSEIITKLKNESDSIGAVLDVIRGIAEQTNLLALNAAIEAARAGEQGRGFAVVADEVRTLASRTQQSTQEIQDMIERLQVGANDAVTAMKEGKKRADDSVEQAANAGETLDEITRFVHHIKSMNLQIATAAEQQSATADEINRNISNISTASRQTSLSAEQTSEASNKLTGLTEQLKNSITGFKLA